MSENRRQVLEMLSVGQITADEAEGLIAALEKERPSASSTSGSEPVPKAKPKYLRVLVVEEGKEGKSPTNVNIRVPMQLLRAGVKLASVIPVQTRVQVNDALLEQGIKVDLSQITPENLEELIEHLGDLTVDVDDQKKTRVRVFCE